VLWKPTLCGCLEGNKQHSNTDEEEGSDWFWKGKQDIMKWISGSKHRVDTPFLHGSVHVESETRKEQKTSRQQEVGSGTHRLMLVAKLHQCSRKVKANCG
jgi:hypothetical protein